MRGNAYSNFNQFIQPVRQPNSTLFIPKQMVRRNKPVTHRVPVPNYNPVGSYSNHHLQARNPFLTVGKRIDQIKLEKEALLEQLRENDTLEKKLLEESELSRKKTEEEGLERIHREMRLLKERLSEKERQEKWILDKTRQDKEDREKRDLANVQHNRDELVGKIADYEKRISEIRDQTEIQKLQQEKEEVTRKWKQIDLEEQARIERDEIEKKAAVLKQKEQQDIEQMELKRLQEESTQLKSLLDSKTNEQTWLQRRIAPDTPTPKSVDGNVADDETIRPGRRITKRRNRRSNTCNTTNNSTQFHNTDRSLEDRFQQLTKEAGTYSPPHTNPVPPPVKTEYDTDYNNIFNQLLVDIRAKQNNVTSTDDSDRLAFMYKTLSMLTQLNKKDTPHLDQGGTTNSQNGNSNISNQDNQDSILPTHFGSETDQDSEVETIRKTMTGLSQLINESTKDSNDTDNN
jgi:hypothetical protein